METQLESVQAVFKIGFFKAKHLPGRACISVDCTETAAGECVTSQGNKSKSSLAVQLYNQRRTIVLGQQRWLGNKSVSVTCS